MDRPQCPHKPSNPKVPINQESNTPSVFIETSDYTWHQVPNDYQVANSDTKTFDRNGRVEYDGCIRVCDLRESEEGRKPAV